MFDQHKEPAGSAVPENNQPNHPENKDSANRPGSFNTENVKVHTMPEKFLSANKQKIVNNKTEVKRTAGSVTTESKSDLKRNVIVGIIIGAVVISILGLGFWFLIQSIRLPEETQPPVANNNLTEQTNQENQQSAEEQGCSAEKCSACDRLGCEELPGVCIWDEAGFCQELEQADLEPNLDGETIVNLELASDLDFDLLTDMEEILWGTNPLNTDTDGDGYNDGLELISLFDPTVKGDGSGRLIDSGLIQVFSNSDYNYLVFYPTGWKKQTDFLDQVIFTAENDDFVQIIVQDNLDQLSAKDWYLQQNSAVEATGLIEREVAGMPGVQTLDGLNLYLADEKYIYILSYNIGLKSELNFRTTFEMMIKSFKAGK